MFKNDVGYIIWKIKDGMYHCYDNNCNIKKNISLKAYVKYIMYDEQYDKILSNHEDQIYDGSNYKMLLKWIPEDIIIELRLHVNINIQFLSTLSHKIRNPLSNIFGILSILEGSKIGKNEKEYHLHNGDVVKLYHDDKTLAQLDIKDNDTIQAIAAFGPGWLNR